MFFYKCKILCYARAKISEKIFACVFKLSFYTAGSNRVFELNNITNI
jgi:hypothetical protein